MTMLLNLGNYSVIPFIAILMTMLLNLDYYFLYRLAYF